MLVEGIELYRHQQVFLSLLQSDMPIAGFLEAGTGKTLPVLYFIAKKLIAGDIEDVLIVAPAATKGVWSRDMDKFEPDVREKLEQALTVVSYDLVWRREEYRKHWGIIVLDESHYIKSRTAKRSKALLKMALDSDFRVILTGTPIGNKRMEDIWSQFTFLYPQWGYRGTVKSQIFGSWKDFTDRYCILDKYWKPYRYLRVSELQDIINQYSYRVTKEECLDLPDVLPDEVWEIDLGEPKLYKEMANHGVIEKLQMVADNSLTQSLRLRQICSGFVSEGKEITPLRNKKIQALSEFLDGHEKKLVIYAEFTYSIRAISQLLMKRGTKHVILDGKTRDKNIWKKFQSDDSIRVIVCQSQAAGAGIDLFAADTELYYEMTTSSVVHEQCRARIHRVGQTQKCSYVYFITKGSMERTQYRTLKDQLDFSDKVFGEYLKDFQKGRA